MPVGFDENRVLVGKT